MTRRDALILRDNDLTGLVADIKTGNFATQALRHQSKLDVLTESELIEFEEAGEDFLIGHAQRAQECRDGHLTATVDTEEQGVFRVKLEVNPRTTVGDDARRKQQLARRMGLAAVMLEEHAGRAVQLTHDDALSPVDDKGTGIRHERDFAHVDFLFFHFLDVAGIAIQNHQTDTRA